MERQTLIGIDVGTTAVKAALHDLQGRVIARFSQAYPTRRIGPDGVEQDPADWLRLVLSALDHLSASLAGGRVAGIGICSQVNTHVFVGGDGRALMPAMTWQDIRCRREADVLDAQVSMADRLSWWGAPLPIDASHVLARMAHVLHHHPDIWAATRLVMAPKDYVILGLTGEAVADPMASFGIVDSHLAVIAPLVGLVEGAAERLAPIHGFMHEAGRIRPGLPLEGTPVFNGTMDAWSGLFGTGAVEEGQAMYLSGTSEILGIVSSRHAPTPGVIAFPRCQSITLHAGPTQAGGAALAWLGQLVGHGPQALSEMAAGVDPDREVPLFLPHLQGERAPIWDPLSRACFAGMDSATGPADLALSVMEGVAYAVRWLAGSLEQSADRTVSAWRAAGGGMASDVWCQVRADVLGQPIHRMASLDAGVLGAAVIAGVGAGLYADAGQAAANLVHVDRVFEPDPARAGRHQQRFALYRDLYEGLKPVHAGLQAMRG